MSSNDQPRPKTVHETSDVAEHQLSIRAAPETLFLQRVLQKCAVPEIEVLGVRYAAHDAAGTSAIELHLRCTPARAALTAAKLGKLTSSQHVELKTAPGSRR